MKHRNVSRFSIRMSLALVAFLPACDSSTGAPPPVVTPVVTPAPVAAPVVKNEPTAERVKTRSQDHWAKMAKGDWVAVHDMLAPEVRSTQPLAKYLAQVQFHKYDNPVVLEVIAIEKDAAYVRCSALWTPTHPEVSRVKLEPGQTLTQEINVVESWRWAEGDWTYVKMERDNEFFEAHADLLKKDKDAGAESKTPPPAK